MIAFRVDANEHIATGHLMRCIAVAAELKTRGETCIFFLAERKGVEWLEDRGFPYVVLQSRWNHLEDELPIMKEMLKQYSPDWLFVDSYQVTAEYLRQLNHCVPVLYLDDMAKIAYPVSMVLHYSDWLEDDSYQKKYAGTDTKVLVGMKFVPLREEFYPRKEKKYTGNVLVTTGGTDTYNVTGKLLKEIFEAPLSQKNVLQEMTYHVIVGNMNQYKKELQALGKRYPNIVLHYNVNTMGEMMRNSDIAISAGGTTLFELCACQIPTICFSFADNQKEFTEKMGEKQVMLYAGDSRSPNVDIAKSLCEKLLLLKSCDSYSKKLIENMGLLVDDKGTYRIVEALYGLF